MDFLKKYYQGKSLKGVVAAKLVLEFHLIGILDVCKASGHIAQISG
jgi:hypothetical protein